MLKLELIMKMVEIVDIGGENIHDRDCKVERFFMEIVKMEDLEEMEVCGNFFFTNGSDDHFLVGISFYLHDHFSNYLKVK